MIKFQTEQERLIWLEVIYLRSEQDSSHEDDVLIADSVIEAYRERLP